MQAFFEWLWKLWGERPHETRDIRSYHARRRAQELVLLRQASTSAARQARHALAMAHLELMEAAEAASSPTDKTPETIQRIDISEFSGS